MATKQQIPVLAARLVEFQEEFSILSTDDAQWAIMHGKEAAVLCAKAIANRQKSILRLISGGHDLKLKASDGSRLICEATDVFKYIDPSFVELRINKPGIATSEILPDIHEMVDDGTFMDIFQALPGSWHEKWLPQDKVVDFCEKFPDWFGPECFTAFLLKKDENKPIDEKNPDDNLIVVCVSVNDGGIYVAVDRLGRAYVWCGECHHRVVSPQLPLIK